MTNVNAIVSHDPMRGRASFSLSDVAVMTGLSLSTIYRQVKSGQLKTVKIGARTIVNAADFETWLSGGRTGDATRGRD